MRSRRRHHESCPHEPRQKATRIEAPLSEELIRHRPAAQFSLDQDRFLKCVRRGRKGAAGGPSGMTTEHDVVADG